MQIEDIKVGTCFTMSDPYSVKLGKYFKVIAFTKTGILVESYDSFDTFINEHILSLIPENVKSWELRNEGDITYYMNVYKSAIHGVYASAARTDFQSTKNAANDYNTSYLYTMKTVGKTGTIFNILGDISDFKVVCDEKINTGEIIDNNQFIIDIYTKTHR